MRTSAEIKADIAELKISIALAYDDDRADMESDLASLFEELDEALAAEPVPDKYAPTGGLNLPLVEKAFGSIPEEWDEPSLDHLNPPHTQTKDPA
jgi:hypothetical protein